jgi:plasmid stabilization system protein ParE
MAQVVWNRKAVRQFEKIQEYLSKEFGDKTTEEFTKRVFNFLDLLSDYPDLGTVENKERNIRGFLLHRHTTLFYKIGSDKIYLLAMFDNRQDPKKPKY